MLLLCIQPCLWRLTAISKRPIWRAFWKATFLKRCKTGLVWKENQNKERKKNTHFQIYLHLCVGGKKKSHFFVLMVNWCRVLQGQIRHPYFCKHSDFHLHTSPTSETAHNENFPLSFSLIAYYSPHVACSSGIGIATFAPLESHLLCVPW